MKITQEEVTHVANLSKLKFSEEETAEFATTLSKIVDMVELLGEVDTTGVEPTTTMADHKTVLRPDVAEEGTDRDRAFVTIDEDQALAQAKAIDETGIDADKAFTCFLMKATKGQANPQVALKLLAQELAKLKEE